MSPKKQLACVSVVALFSLPAWFHVRAAEPVRVQPDPLPLDSLWKGKLTQGGKTPNNLFFPPELDAELTITLRSGNDFEAELHESSDNLDITYLVRGSVAQGADKSLTIRFRSHGVKGVPKAGAYYLNVPYVAKFSGDALKGSWSYEDKEDEVGLEGTFHLTRTDE